LDTITLIVIVALVVWNIIVFALYGIDKLKARKRLRRISESFLLICTFIIGSVGALLGMTLFRHKTRHLKFRTLVPLALILHIIIAVLIFRT